MRATFDAGIRFQVADTLGPRVRQPSPNAGIYNPLQPQILMIPRRPTTSSTTCRPPTSGWRSTTTSTGPFWGRDLSFAEILANESDVLAQYLLKGENDPWMFTRPTCALRDRGEPAGRSARRDVRSTRGGRGDHPADLAGHGGPRAAGRRSHALQRLRASGPSIPTPTPSRARRQRGGGADHRRLRAAAASSTRASRIASVNLSASGASTTLALLWRGSCGPGAAGGTGGHRRDDRPPGGDTGAADDRARPGATARPGRPARPGRRQRRRRSVMRLAVQLAQRGRGPDRLRSVGVGADHGRHDGHGDGAVGQLRRGVEVVAHRLQLRVARGHERQRRHRPRARRELPRSPARTR
jgi:hypothetical protein